MGTLLWGIKTVAGNILYLYPLGGYIIPNN